MWTSVLSGLVVAAVGQGSPKITPIEHASVLLTYPSGPTTPLVQLYSDPVDQFNEGLFDKLPPADIILITHSHADHFQPSTIEKLWKSTTRLIAPADVAASLKLANTTVYNGTTVLGNGQSANILNLGINAVPMYNTGPNPHHPPGKWNGYVVLIHDDQPGSVYISGDTQFIPEMKTNFGFGFRFARAFLCMNLPYTMGVPEASEATLAFKPMIVTPYHYKNEDKTLSNITEFKDLVTAKMTPTEPIAVDLLNFYPYGSLGQFQPERTI